MGVISWYIFIILFFGSFALGGIIGGILMWLHLGVIIGSIVGFLLGMALLWKTLNFGRKILIEESTKSIQSLLVTHGAFILSAIILYKLIAAYVVIPHYSDYVFFGSLGAFLLFKTVILIFLRIPIDPQKQNTILKK